MNTIVESVNSVQKRIKITIPAEKINLVFASETQKQRKKVKVDGFRSGKVPLSIVKKMYSNIISYNVAEQLIKDNLYSQIQKEEIPLISKPFVEMDKTPVEGEEYVLSALVDVMPDIILGDNHKGLEAKYEHIEVSSDDIEKHLGQIARQQAKVTPIEGDHAVCQLGNLALVSYEGRINNEIVPEYKVEKANIEVGANNLPSSDFDSALKGMKSNETKSFTVTFKDEKTPEKLRNKPINFSLSLHEFKSIEVPAINDEFAKDQNFDSLTELRSKTKKDLEKSAEDRNQDSINNALLKSLSERINFEVPPSITDQFIDSMVRNNFGIKDEKEINKALSNKDLREYLLPQAKSQSRNSILLQQVIKSEKLEISDEEVKDYFETSFQMPDEQKKKREVELAVKTHGEQIKQQLIFTKALACLRGFARIERKTKI